ncbi:translation protein [Mycena galericulata]|nr:translation protein [Mycena galericulata]
MLRLWALVERPPLVAARRIHSTPTSFASPTASTPHAEPVAPPKWTPNSIRTGVIARKRGMTVLWTDQGARIPVTLDHCQVTANIKTIRRNHTEYHAVQVGASDRPAKTESNQMLGHFNKAGVPPKRIVKEFPVTSDAHVPVGTTLSAIHFVPGQFVDVVANGIGKGFAGGMKRWGFHAPGSWSSIPGKKMAGRLGGKRITTQNLAVVRIDTTLDLVYVRGAVPGFDDAHVLITDAKKKMIALSSHNQAKGLYEKRAPPSSQKTLPSIIESPAYRRSPFIPQE